MSPGQPLTTHQLSTSTAPPPGHKATPKWRHRTVTQRLQACPVPSLSRAPSAPPPQGPAPATTSSFLLPTFFVSPLNHSLFILPVLTHFSSHWKSARQKDVSLETVSFRTEGDWKQHHNFPIHLKCYQCVWGRLCCRVDAEKGMGPDDTPHTVRPFFSFELGTKGKITHDRPHSSTSSINFLILISPYHTKSPDRRRNDKELHCFLF